MVLSYGLVIVLISPICSNLYMRIFRTFPLIIFFSIQFSFVQVSSKGLTLACKKCKIVYNKEYNLIGKVESSLMYKLVKQIGFYR